MGQIASDGVNNLAYYSSKPHITVPQQQSKGCEPPTYRSNSKVLWRTEEVRASSSGPCVILMGVWLFLQGK